MKKVLVFIIVCVMCVMVFTSCAKDTKEIDLELNKNYKIEASDAFSNPTEVEWTSSDKSIASIYKNTSGAYVTGKGVGEATITGTLNGNEVAVYTFNVDAVKAQSFKLDQSSIDMELTVSVDTVLDGIDSVTFTTDPENADNYYFNVESDNEKIVSASIPEGTEHKITLRAHQEGDATVTLTNNANGKTAKLVVNVTRPQTTSEQLGNLYNLLDRLRK